MVMLPTCGVPPRPVPLNDVGDVARLLRAILDPVVGLFNVAEVTAVEPVPKDTVTVVVPEDGVVIERTAQTLLRVKPTALMLPGALVAKAAAVALSVLAVPVAFSA